MPVYIEKINGDIDRPTNQPTDQQGEYRAICLFESLKLEKRQRITIRKLSQKYSANILFFFLDCCCLTRMIFCGW